MLSVPDTVVGVTVPPDLMPAVYGQAVDAQTRCVHYNSAVDVIAIKFVCCGRYYPCFECHAGAETHSAEQWPRARWAEAAILCGGCRSELSIDEYKQALTPSGDAASDLARCPRCSIAINARCSLHAHLYFEA